MILTVTLNPALDRVMTVPNFEPGFRHRATGTLILPGGKGINVARVIRTLGRPVIATGFVGGKRGDLIIGDLNDEGILCDFVRIQGESRISTAIIDPTNNSVTEVNEHGPGISEDELSLMFAKLEYLGKAADVVVMAGSMPPGLPPDTYAEMISLLKAQGPIVVFYTFGEPLRLGLRAGADFAFPKQGETEEIMGHEFSDQEDLLRAVRTLREMGTRSVVISHRQGCVGELAVRDGVHTVLGRVPPVDAVSRLGWRDALVGGFVMRMAEGDSPLDCLRFGLGCAVANSLRHGAGVLSPSDAVRLAADVELQEVAVA